MIRSIIFSLLGAAASVAAGLSPFIPTSTATTLSTLSTAVAQIPAAQTTAGPPVIIRDDPIPGPNRTTLYTTFENGDVVTGKFELMTLTEYTDLKQHLTVTSTTTYEGSDGVKQVAENAVGIIMAGGLTWMLLNFVEAAGVFLDVLEEVAEDSTKCSGMPPRCPRLDCLGNSLGFCLFPGDLFGCICEKDECPGAELFCYECEGRDDKCQKGDFEGCPCTTEKCPDGVDTLRCEDCGQDGDKYGICDGLSHQGKRYAGCECMVSSETEPYPGMSDEEMEELADKQEHLPEWDGNFALSAPGDCLKSKDWAPQRATDGQPNVEQSINAFCEKYDGTILQGHSGANSRTDPWEVYELYSTSEEVGFWLRAEWRSGVAIGGEIYAQCPKYEKIVGHECARLLKETMALCDPLVGETHGVTVKGFCINYSIIIDRDEAMDGRSPPWARTPESGRWGTCSTDLGTADHHDITDRYFQHMYPVFCDHGDDTLTLTSKDFRDNIEVPESDDAPRPRASDGEDYAIKFSYRRNSAGNCYKTCAQSFNTISKGPCGHHTGSANLGKYHMAARGEVHTGCAIWRYEIKTVEGKALPATPLLPAGYNDTVGWNIADSPLNTTANIWDTAAKDWVPV